jgi:hypothetical protein
LAVDDETKKKDRRNNPKVLFHHSLPDFDNQIRPQLTMNVKAGTAPLWHATVTRGKSAFLHGCWR